MRTVVKRTAITAMMALIMAISVVVIPGGNPQAYAASADTIKVDLLQSEGEGGKGIHDVSKDLYGIFFEDINHGADGGMSAEMVTNQSFEYEYIDYDNRTNGIVADNLRWWSSDTNTLAYATGQASTKNGMSKTNKTSLKIVSKFKGYRMYNAGFQGDDFNKATSGAHNAPLTADYAMNFINGKQYELSFYVRQDEVDPYRGNIDVYAQNKEGEKITTEATFAFSDSEASSEWKKVKARITAKTTDLGALFFDFQGSKTVYLDFISLMPFDAYGMNDSRYSGGKIKREIVDIFAAMKPKFLRFPGGCVAEGDISWENVYDWQRTVGAIEERRGTPNTWEYWQSYNIGFYEYFLLCEDLKMKPMPVVSAGLICQARMGESGALMYKYDDPEFIEQVVNKVLHLIYFAKGSATSADPDEKKWAQLRTDMGHSEPFELEYISIGNENWGKVYWDNFAAALAELRNYKYGYYASNPTNMLEKWNITAVTTSGTDVWTPSRYNLAWKEINGESAQKATTGGKYKDLIVDEHYYGAAKWYRDNNSHYDSYDRGGAQVFVGEYSANGGGGSTINDLEAALSEAAYMTGLERNGDIVKMASYAPFFGRSGNSNWATNAIWLNAKNIMLTPNYYVQQMFGEKVGDKYIPTDFKIANCETSVTNDTKNKEIIVKLVNTGSSGKNITIDLSSVDGIANYYSGKTMQNNNQAVKNKLENDYDGNVIQNVAPIKIKRTTFEGGKLLYNMQKYSVSVLVFSYGETQSNSKASSIKVFGKPIENFEPNTLDYTINIDSMAAVPYMFVEGNGSAEVDISYAKTLKDKTTITIKAANGDSTVYNISYTSNEKNKDENKKGCAGCSSKTTASGGILMSVALLALVAIITKKRKNRA